MIHLSYIPFRYFVPTGPIGSESLVGVDSRSLPAIRQLVWGRDPDFAIPNLMVDRAREVVEHMKWWSEGDVSEWFTLVWDEGEDYYFLALVPNLDRSSARVIELMGGVDYPPPGTWPCAVHCWSVLVEEGRPQRAVDVRSSLSRSHVLLCFQQYPFSGYSETPLECFRLRSVELGSIDRDSYLNVARRYLPG